MIDSVDSGLTEIYQSPDVVINNPLKDQIRKKYQTLMASRMGLIQDLHK